MVKKRCDIFDSYTSAGLQCGIEEVGCWGRSCYPRFTSVATALSSKVRTLYIVPDIPG
jgi:hypothetical protein